uniref:Integral membrane protein n=1 Tax=Globodera pallida TaxID=36090 RepID=A0A183CGA0_GLOPA
MTEHNIWFYQVLMQDLRDAIGEGRLTAFANDFRAGFEMADHCCSAKGKELERLAVQAEQRRVLTIVLVINAAMFFLEFGAGVIAGSRR